MTDTPIADHPSEQAAAPPLVCRACARGDHGICSRFVSNEDVDGPCTCTHPASPAESLPLVPEGDLGQVWFGPWAARAAEFGLPVGAVGSTLSEAELVEHERLEHERELAELAEQRWASICPARFHGFAWRDMEQPGSTIVELHAWRDKALVGAPGSLLLIGGLGVGKTLASLLLAQDLHSSGARVRFAPAVELLDAIRPDGGGDIADFTSPELLVIDDLASEKPSEWTLERLYLIINRRWLDMRPTVVTTNLEPKPPDDDPSRPNLRDAIGARTYDRLMDDGVAVRLVGDTRRRPRQ